MSGIGVNRSDKSPDASPPAKAADGVADGVNLWSYATALLRHRYLVLGLALVAGAWTGGRSLVSPRKYTAAASFVPQEMAAQAGVSQLASQLGFGTTRASTSSPQFYVDLLQSREILRDVVTRSYNVSGSGPFTGDLVQFFKIVSPDRDEAVARAVQKLKVVLTVRANASTGVVRFDVHTTSPQLSLQITNRLLELVNDYNLRRRQSQARAEREFVEQRLGLAQQALTAAEDAIIAFSRRNRRYADSPELVAEEARLQRQVNLRQQVYFTLAQSYEVAKIDEVRNTPVITVVERPEGFVEKRARGTIAKAIIALFGGTLLAVVLAFTIEYLKAARSAGSRHYLEFVALQRQVVAELRGGWFRRVRR